MPYISGNYTRLSFLVFIILTISFTKLQAQDLQLFPKRVVFEGAKRIEELTVINSGKDTANYNISFVQNRMTENGGFESITEPDSGQFFADQNLRIFPRRVTLLPGEAQTVKVQAIRTSQLAPGEYRSHLYFRALPNAKPLGEEENKIETGEGISMQLRAVYGVSIPVIIRSGTTTAKISIAELSLKSGKDAVHQLQLTFTRSGNSSVYGDVEVSHISPEGKNTQLGLAKGVAVYTPGTVRNFQLRLQEQPEINFQSGKLLVAYKSQKDGRILAESELDLLTHVLLLHADRF